MKAVLRTFALFMLFAALSSQPAEAISCSKCKKVVKQVAPVVVPGLAPAIIAADPEKAKEAVEDAASDIKDAGEDAASDVKDAAEDAVSDTKDAVSTAAEQKGDAVETAVNQTGDAAEVAIDQIDAEADRFAEDTNDAYYEAKRQFDTNLESVNQWLTQQEASFCKAMSGGEDEQCMEQGAEASTDDEGNITVSNPTTGQSYPVTSSEDREAAHEAVAKQAEAAAATLAFRIMEPKENLANSPNWQRTSKAVGAQGIYAWGLALDNLPEETAKDSQLQSLWRQLESAYEAANTARNSGDARPIVLVGGIGQDTMDAGDAIKLAYDSHGNAKDVWDVLMGTYKFSWIGVAKEVATEALSPESISKTSEINSNLVRQVPGLYPEEKAAIEAGAAYYRALPPEVRTPYEIEQEGPADQLQLKDPQ